MSNSTIQKTPSVTGKFQSSSTRTKKKSMGSTSRANGKSKYAQKSRKPKPPVVAKRKDPVYSYTSVCCGLPAVKKPCVTVGKKDALVQSLGKFRCTGCKKRAKVTVSKFKPAESLTKDGWKPSDALKPGEEVRAIVPASTPAVKDNPYITDPKVIEALEALPKAEVLNA